VITGEALAPTAAAALRAASSSYVPVFVAVAVCSLGAALRGRQPRRGRSA
jgi:hypothetical protein